MGERSASPPRVAPTDTERLPAATPSPPEACASCGAPRLGRFCEVCGHDADLPTPPPPAAPEQAGEAPPRWSALVRADRGWFDEVRRRDGPDASDLRFPPFCPERRFELDGPQLLVGRASRSRGVAPDIDLSGPPLDPGVSTVHALLVARDGGWDVVDLGSTNGTVVDSGDPVPANTPVPLHDGTVVKIGAWTTITLHTGGAPH